METLLNRYRNITVLLLAIFAQLVLLDVERAQMEDAIATLVETPAPLFKLAPATLASPPSFTLSLSSLLRPFSVITKVTVCDTWIPA